MSSSRLLDNLVAAKKRYFYDGDVRLEFPYHNQRVFLLKALLSLFMVVLDKQPAAASGCLDRANVAREFVREFVGNSLNPEFLAGEYAVPQFLFVYWYICLNSGMGTFDGMLLHVLEALLKQNADDDASAQIPNPYHLMPEVLERRLTPQLLTSRTSKESFRNQLWTALPLFGLLVRRNLKQLARRTFPEMTKFIHRQTIVKQPWSFALYRAEDAEELGERLEFPATWESYIERTRSQPPPIPDGLREDLLTLGLFLIVCPFRLTEQVTFHIDEMLLGNWHR